MGLGKKNKTKLYIEFHTFDVWGPLYAIGLMIFYKINREVLGKVISLFWLWELL